MELDAVTANKDEPEPFTETGLKLADDCAGRPLNERFTEPAKLFVVATVTEKFVVLPANTATDAGVAEMVNGMSNCTCTCATALVAVIPLLSVAIAEKA